MPACVVWTSDAAAQIERRQLGRRVAGIEARQRPRVTLARQQRVREPRAQLLRFRHARHGQHPRGAAVDGTGQRRAGAENVDDHRDATRGAGTRDVIEDLNPHADARAGPPSRCARAG